MHIDEVLARRRAPVSDDQRLHVRQFQRLSQQRIVVKIDLPNGQIVGSAPVGIHLAQQFRRESIGSGIHVTQQNHGPISLSRRTWPMVFLLSAYRVTLVRQIGLPCDLMGTVVTLLRR